VDFAENGVRRIDAETGIARGDRLDGVGLLVGVDQSIRHRDDVRVIHEDMVDPQQRI
jgi:hypothetical protein